MTAFVWRFLLALICCCLQMGGCGAGKQSADRSEASSSSAPSNGKDSGNSDGSDYHFFRIPSSILQEKDDVASSTKTNATATAKNAYDQVAKQLAGLHVPDDRLNDPSAINYAKFIAEEWDSLMKASLSPISGWAEEHVTPFVGDVKVVFYPFGGPDIAYAVRFFPTAQSYVLVGLEPIGNFDSIKNEVRSASLLASVEGAISYFLHHGFFVTYDMITQLSHKNTKGGLCLILLELARLGFDINSVENISINAGGLEVANESNALRCIKIIFNKAGESILRTVYYVKADLQNSRDGRVICLKKFLERAPFVTLVKSASYAMHDSAFSQIRDFILSNTRLLLQDDSGIPFHYFNSLRWEKYIFGEYTVPTLKVFQKNKQIDLANYYAAHDKIGIPFKIGYGYSRERPNLLLAIPRRFVAKASATKAAGSFSSPGRAYPDFVALAHSFVRKNGNGGGCSCNKKARPRELPQIPPVEERFLLPIPPDIVELWIHWPNARLQIRRSH